MTARNCRSPEGGNAHVSDIYFGEFIRVFEHRYSWYIVEKIVAGFPRGSRGRLRVPDHLKKGGKEFRRRYFISCGNSERDGTLRWSKPCTEYPTQRVFRTIQKMASSAGPHSTIVFDGDDTLWRTMPLYTKAKQRFFTLLGDLGFDAKCVEEEFEARDVSNVAAWGFTVERFRRSMVETYKVFAQREGKTPLLKVEQRISGIATSVARNKTRPMPRAREVLRALYGRSRLVLLTKGEYALQERRVAESGFHEFFERVVIVEHKERETFLRLTSELCAAAKAIWSVGDSLRSDIYPAIEAGLNAVWIPQETWDYENAQFTEDPRIVRARAIRELPGILRKAGAPR
jgi:putative hydrolase of the HAD superfamily